MLKFYFSTVIIYVVIMLATFMLLGDRIVKNGWCDGEKKLIYAVDNLIALFLISAIPVYRLVAIYIIILMAGKNKDDDFWKKK